MKIGIFGGTFDPIHLGHLALARHAQVQFSLDKVLFIPTYQTPHKPTSSLITSAKHRYAMAALAIEKEPLFEICDCELKRQGISYTFETLEQLHQQYPRASFFLILGEDSLDGIDDWYQAEQIKQRVTCLVARRKGCDGHVSLGFKVEWIHMPLYPISASKIREAIRQGRPVEQHLSGKIYQYIQRHRLYRGSDL